ncbi:MAG: TonB family protein [Candidatus Omnitrophica bacterium]|nr:TonB family protein [Candidatus Omnitrophota bacterium]
MRIAVVAGALSVGLHGFLLMQWPGPFVQPPRWQSSEPITVTYLPAWEPLNEASRRAWPPGPAASPLEKPSGAAKRVSDRRVPRAGAPARPQRGMGGIVDPREDGGVGSRQDPAVSPHARPVPSLLTPADFAAFQYKQAVRARLQRAIRYPAQANGGQGSVRLQLTIGRTGALQAASCDEPSAPVFAEAAMEGMTAAAPFPPMPAELTLASETYEFFVAFLPGEDATIELSP